MHIHFKVRVFSGSRTTFEFNSQFFFDPVTTNEIYVTSAYSSRGTPNVPNAADNIYGSDGAKLLVALSPNGRGGYDGTFVVGLSGLPSTGGGTGERRRRGAQRGEVPPACARWSSPCRAPPRAEARA